MHGTGLVAIVLAVFALGCGREATLRQLRDDNPRVQTSAIARVAREGDRSMTGELIRLLDSDDEAVRFMAASALHKMTGRETNFHFAKPEERQRIVAEWRQWWEKESGESLAPPEEKKTAAASEGQGGPAAATPKESGS